MPNSGDKIMASDFAFVRTKVNDMLTTYSQATVGAIEGVGVIIKSSNFQSLKDKLELCNNHVSNKVKADLSTITNFSKGFSIVGTLLDLIETKATELRTSFCSCDCNYACTCNCAYSCTCNCNYSCTCNCNYCTCDCNHCSCDCNHCSCDCNYCTCECNYCTCDCNYSCTCNCNYACTCNCNYACTCNCAYCSCDCDDECGIHPEW